MGHDDWEVVRYCRTYGKRYFDILIRRHFALILNICARFLGSAEAAEEAAQDIFLKVYLSLDRARNTGQPFKHWLCRVAANHCRNILKRRRRAHEIISGGEVDFWYESSPFESSETAGIERREEIQMVNRALQALPFKERSVLVLSSVAELGVAEIADILNKPQYTVRRRLRRARQKLKQQILHFLMREYGNKSGKTG